MKNDTEIIMNEFLQMYKKLYPEYQQSVLWFIDHFDFIEKILKGEPISCDALYEGIEYAKRQREYTLHIIFLLKRTINE